MTDRDSQGSIKQPNSWLVSLTFVMLSEPRFSVLLPSQASGNQSGVEPPQSKSYRSAEA